MQKKIQKMRVFEFKGNFSQALTGVFYQGQEIIVYRHDTPMARLVPISEKERKKLGKFNIKTA